MKIIIACLYALKDMDLDRASCLDGFQLLFFTFFLVAYYEKNVITAIMQFFQITTVRIQSINGPKGWSHACSMHEANVEKNNLKTSCDWHVRWKRTTPNGSLPSLSLSRSRQELGT